MKKESFVGVFDSGLGGLSVLAELVKTMPEVNFEYLGDSANAPYGTKPPEFVIERSLTICEDFVNRGAAAIVIACNTATSVAAAELRARHSIPVIGMEPAVKPAMAYVKDRCGREGNPLKIAVLATPMTLAEKKYKDLVGFLGAGDRVIEIPAPELVQLVEESLLDEERTRRFTDAFYRSKILPCGDLGAIVLGCTHFVFLRRYFEELSDGIEVFDGNRGTALRLKSLLALENSAHEMSLFRGWIKVQSTAGAEKTELSKKLLRYELTRGDYGRVEESLTDLIQSRLSGREQDFAKMYYFERRPMSEIAEALGLNEKRLRELQLRVSASLFKYLRNV